MVLFCAEQYSACSGSVHILCRTGQLFSFSLTRMLCSAFLQIFEDFLYSFKYCFGVDGPLWSSGQSSWLHNGDVLCFLWGTNWIYICYVEESRPPLWCSGQCSWIQIQRSGFDSRRHQIFWEAVGLERPLSLVSTTEELLVRKSSGPGLESRDYGHRGSAALTTLHQPICKNWH
jgi:hypothetical protein